MVSDSAQTPTSPLTLTVNGETVTVDEQRVSGRGPSLLEVLREQLGLHSVKDGCSPQGQCGCCTVLVDGQPRVACVTPARRVRGRTITTLEGLDSDTADRWAHSFCAAGASQCGFCTPGIIMRLEGTSRSTGPEADVNQALLAHLCRCTGWQTIHEAWDRFHSDTDGKSSGRSEIDGQSRAPSGVAVAIGGQRDDRDFDAAALRASLEGGAPQRVGPDVARGFGPGSAGFAADTAPAGTLIAVRADDGSWVVGHSLAEARDQAGKVQGRRTTAAPHWPLEVPPGEWDVTMRTTWIDPAYLETDASWCEPGGEPVTTVANGGAFGAKQFPVSSGGAAGLDVGSKAQQLAKEHGQPVLALASREDVARFGVKRPPIAAGITSGGRAHVRVADTPGIVDGLMAGFAAAGIDGNGVTIESLSVPGPPVSASVRAAGWAEAIVLAAGAAGAAEPVRSPAGAEAEAEVDVAAGVIRVSVACGPLLDEVILRSYCIGAAHMAWSWLTSEALNVDAEGVVHDLTVRSFGVLRAVDTPRIEVELRSDLGRSGRGQPVNGSDAVFAAVAASGWLALGCKQDWPVGL